jgi:hypothetical protein
LIGRKGYALNAIGLFAPEAQATLEAKRSHLGVYDSRFGEPENHITLGLTEEHVAQVEADSGNKREQTPSRGLAKFTYKAFRAIQELSECPSWAWIALMEWPPVAAWLATEWRPTWWWLSSLSPSGSCEAPNFAVLDVMSRRARG